MDKKTTGAPRPTTGGERTLRHAMSVIRREAWKQKALAILATAQTATDTRWSLERKVKAIINKSNHSDPDWIKFDVAVELRYDFNKVAWNYLFPMSFVLGIGGACLSFIDNLLLHSVGLVAMWIGLIMPCSLIFIKELYVASGKKISERLMANKERR